MALLTMALTMLTMSLTMMTGPRSSFVIQGPSSRTRALAGAVVRSCVGPIRRETCIRRLWSG